METETSFNVISDDVPAEESQTLAEELTDAALKEGYNALTGSDAVPVERRETPTATSTLPAKAKIPVKKAAHSTATAKVPKPAKKLVPVKGKPAPKPTAPTPLAPRTPTPPTGKPENNEDSDSDSDGDIPSVADEPIAPISEKGDSKRSGASPPLSPVSLQKSHTSLGHESDVDTDYSGLPKLVSLLEARITTLTKEQTRFRRFQVSTEDYLTRLGGEVTKMQSMIDQQQTRIEALTAENERFRVMFDTELTKIQKDFSSQVADVSMIYRDTPDLVERLMKVTNEVMTHLPEDIKTTMKTVELMPPEKKVVDIIKSKTTPPKRKLPKHAR